MIRAKNRKTFGAAPKAPQFHKRRKPIEGEDLPALKNVMRDIEGQNIALEDFILLIAPHTGDKGATLTKVMADDLNNFRRFCNEAYDTMTKDTNEVMATTQIELGQLYAERVRLLIVNIINFMKTIHDYIPDFNLEEYNLDSDKYLATKFNILDLPDEVEVDIAKRQLAFHRLNWLQAEGDRLSAENNKLQQRLNELKKIQQKDIAEQISKEREAEAQRIALEKQQAEMQSQLENLVEELLETIVNEEKKTVNERKNTAKNSLSKKKVSTVTGTGSGYKKGLLKRKDSKWSTKAAQEIEISNISSAMAGDPVTVPSSSTIKSAPSSGYKSKLKTFGSAARPRTPRQIGQSSSPPNANDNVPTVSVSASASASVQAPNVKQKAGPATRKKKAKKPVPITQRPAWQDVDVNVEEIQAAAREMEQTPIDIFSIGRSGSSCAPTCSSSGGPETTTTRTRSPVSASATATAQYPTQTQPKAAQRQPSPPRNVGRRAAGPRDTWGGFF